ncbi:MAG: biotin--[acetyl-CoA-carboxylase] ligase [Pirellulaceae bacterium]|nr:biotin--[acetyl-CoA-carboxylase] ligase [Pirellulaceae bacterium]
MKSTLVELLGQNWLRVAQWHQRVDSTNSLARHFVNEQPQQMPALFVADSQERGRGRSDHTWWSPPGCLMFTLAIPASLLPARRDCWGQLALLCGVVVAEAMEKVCPGLTVQLKWPNDLYLANRKAGGILIESVSSPDNQVAFLIGIGINVCVDWATAPEELRHRATCLSSQCGSRVEPSKVLSAFIHNLTRWLDGWGTGELHWYEPWAERCLLTGRLVKVRGNLSGQPVKVSPTPQILAGRCLGVGLDGQLLIRSEQGGVTPISVGEIIEM